MILSPAPQPAGDLAASSPHPPSMPDHPFDEIRRFCSVIGYPRTFDRPPPTRIHTCRLPLSAFEENESSFFSCSQGLEISERYFCNIDKQFFNRVSDFIKLKGFINPDLKRAKLKHEELIL